MPTKNQLKLRRRISGAGLVANAWFCAYAFVTLGHGGRYSTYGTSYVRVYTVLANKSNCKVHFFGMVMFLLRPGVSCSHTRATQGKSNELTGNVMGVSAIQANHTAGS